MLLWRGGGRELPWKSKYYARRNFEAKSEGSRKQCADEMQGNPFGRARQVWLPVAGLGKT
ncbi:hypothetical protein ABIA33_003230 [Streptacidiphilus sp. MAP12-16]